MHSLVARSLLGSILPVLDALKFHSVRNLRTQLLLHIDIGTPDLLAVAQRWLKTNLDIFGAILNSALVFLAVYQRSSSSAGLFAVALLQGSSLSGEVFLALVLGGFVCS